MKKYIQNFWVRFLACILCTVTIVTGIGAGVFLAGVSAFGSKEELYESGQRMIAENYAAYLYDHLEKKEEIEKFLKDKNFTCSISLVNANEQDGEDVQVDTTVVFGSLLEEGKWDYAIEIEEDAYVNYRINSALDALRIIPIVNNDDSYTVDTPITGYVYDVEKGLFYYHAKEISSYFLADYIQVSYDGKTYDYNVKHTSDGEKIYYNSYYGITLDTSNYKEWDWVRLNGVRLNMSHNADAQGKEIALLSDNSSIQSDIYTGLYYEEEHSNTINYSPKRDVEHYIFHIKVNDLSHTERVSDDMFYEWKMICDDFYANKFVYQEILIISIICFVLSFALLIYSANSDKDTIGITQKVPVGIFTLCAAGIELPLLVFANDIIEELFSGYNILPFDIWALLCIITVFAMIFIAAIWLQNMITRFKTGSFIRNSEFYYGYHVMKWVWAKVTYPFKAIWSAVRENTGLFIKGIVLMLVISFIEFMAIMVFWWDRDVYLILFFIVKFVEIPMVVFILIQMQKLQEGGKRIAAGDLSQPIDTGKMLWEFKKHGENINKVSEGIALAVDERMKSERFKTELITNVSHDIKTPLTSIINYVDLIKKEQITDEKLQEYVEVLDRQSARLKKLIEDLMEASKASTGNLTVNMEDCDVEVLLTQLIGEFEEKLAVNQLEVVVQKPENPVMICADGRHMWRVLDNLLNNACKYSLPGTRVYVSLIQAGNEAVITFKNISKAALNIPSDELMERFVRGDSSRNTEGSGLGLSIAQSLTELMKGTMKLEIDGDLFKVTLRFHAKAD